MCYHPAEEVNGRYLGVSVRRREDRGLLTGQAEMVADMRLPGLLDLAFVRSAERRARIAVTDAAPARETTGVVGAWSAADLPDLPATPLAVGDPSSVRGRDWYPLARDLVRYQGEALAVVAADGRASAEDGAERVRVDLEPLPPVLDLEQALADDAPRLFAGLDNVVSEQTFGEPADEVFASAPVVVEAAYRQQFLLPTSLEARAVLARPDDDGGVTVFISHQAQHRLRDSLAAAFGLDEELVRVVVPAVGGAFGAKSATYPEYVLTVYLARHLGRPVRWVEDRAEALLAATRGRGQQQRVRLAATRDGRLLAYELLVDANVGAYPHPGSAIPMSTGAMATGCYATPRVFARIRTVVTSTPPTSAYRGAGRPEAAFAIERTMDLLAARLEMDPAELRRRNFIRTFPYETPSGRTYDSGDYDATLDKALAAADYTALRAEQERRRRAGGTPLGIGIACYVERSGGQPGTDEYGSVEVGADGRVVARCGSTNTGQAHPTTFPQVVASALDIDLDRVTLVQNDTRQVPYGFASFGSRSMQVGGGALWRAARMVVEQARGRAAALWGADLAAVGYREGRVESGLEALDLGKLAELTGPLQAEDRFAPPLAFPFGCYVVVAEVDRTLGLVTIRKLIAVDDYGVVVNPMVVDGQGYGSIAQGLGQALYEDASPGIPSGSLLDYLLPTAADMPPVELLMTSTPNPNTPFGAKGAGEAGCIGVPPAVVNAVCDALGLRHIDMPLTPAAVWAAANAGPETAADW